MNTDYAPAPAEDPDVLHEARLRTISRLMDLPESRSAEDSAALDRLVDEAVSYERYECLGWVPPDQRVVHHTVPVSSATMDTLRRTDPISGHGPSAVVGRSSRRPFEVDQHIAVVECDGQTPAGRVIWGRVTFVLYSPLLVIGGAVLCYTEIDREG